jgi:hypothetical protein
MSAQTYETDRVQERGERQGYADPGLESPSGSVLVLMRHTG